MEAVVHRRRLVPAVAPAAVEAAVTASETGPYCSLRTIAKFNSFSQLFFNNIRSIQNNFSFTLFHWVFKSIYLSSKGKEMNGQINEDIQNTRRPNNLTK